MITIYVQILQWETLYNHLTTCKMIFIPKSWLLILSTTSIQFYSPTPGEWTNNINFPTKPKSYYWTIGILRFRIAALLFSPMAAWNIPPFIFISKLSHDVLLKIRFLVFHKYHFVNNSAQYSSFKVVPLFHTRL